MPCFRPLTGFRSRNVNPSSGKRSIVFSRLEGFSDLPPLTLPCGQCRFCRLEHSRQWALRCMHEASLYETNCFLTLTYSDEFLPAGGSLDYEAPVLFMKRLRAKFGADIRSYGCAEYGEKLNRPHYHLCIFNFDFEDKEILKNGEFKLYRSKALEELWPFGHSSVGGLTFESAAYVARYVTKKITGKRAEAHYEAINSETGEVFRRLPERAICVSRRPGIGRAWLDKFGSYARIHDFVILRGKKVRPAKYYDRIFDLQDPISFAKVKKLRKLNGEKASMKMESEDRKNFEVYRKKFGLGCPPKCRLFVMEDVQELKFKQLKRGFENG